MKSLLVLLVVTSLAGCSGPSQEDIKVASDACQEFIAKKMRVSLDDTKVFDARTHIQSGDVSMMRRKVLFLRRAL